LQLLLFNEECLVSASHQLALITSLPFVTRGLDTVKGATFNDAFQLREEHVAKCDCLPAATNSLRRVVHRLCEGRAKRCKNLEPKVIAGLTFHRVESKCCTHRPSLLPIEWLSEALGLAQEGRQRPSRAGNLVKLGHLEEVKVVTRFP
jgi:hypothetical protein